MRQDWYIQAAIELGLLEQGQSYSDKDLVITPEVESRSNYLDVLINIREARDIQLGQTDWTQANDTPLSTTDKVLWKNYRQALRDCPNELIEGQEDVFEFPTRPDSTE
jgi:hypothetical protein